MAYSKDIKFVGGVLLLRPLVARVRWYTQLEVSAPSLNLYTFLITGSASWKEFTSASKCWPSGTITNQPSTVDSLHGSDLKSFLPFALLKDNICFISTRKVSFHLYLNVFGRK